MTSITHKGDSLKMRVLFIKRDLRALGKSKYMDDFIKKHPEYDNLKSIQKIRNVMNCVQIDLIITEQFEEWVNELKLTV